GSSRVRSSQNGRTRAGRLRASLGSTLHALGQCRRVVCLGGKWTADLSGLSKCWRQNPGEGSAELAEVICPRRLAGWGTAVAPNLHVDLHCNGPLLYRLSDLLGPLSAGPGCAQ